MILSGEVFFKWDGCINDLTAGYNKHQENPVIVVLLDKVIVLRINTGYRVVDWLNAMLRIIDLLNITVKYWRDMSEQRGL